MFRIYFRIAWRNIVKNKVSAIINIGGLAAGMAVAMLIGLWINDELSFDTYNKQYNVVSKIARQEIAQNGESYIADNNNHFPIPLAGELRTSYNNYFTHVALVSESNEHLLSVGDKQFSRTGIFAEPDFMNIFTLKMTEGSPQAFNTPGSMLIRQSLAIALFGNESAIGKVLQLDNKQPVKITGVYEDLPHNSTWADISFICPWSLLVSTEQYVRDNLTNWNNSSFSVYVATAQGITTQQASQAISNVYQARMGNDIAASKVSLFLHPMKDWHLRSVWKNGVHAGGQIQLVWLFALTGLFVLLLACINFMNLSTARAATRAREIGMRKTFGSLRSQLIRQFMTESLLIVCLAFVLSAGLVICSLPWFNNIASKQILFPYTTLSFWGISLIFIAVTGFIAGSYPSFYLSSFQPVKVLKGPFRAGRSAILSRRILVTLQFTVSIVLIVGTIIVYRQVQLAQDRPIGYNRNGLIRIDMKTGTLSDKYNVLQRELLASGGATGFAQSSAATTTSNYFDDRFEWEDKDPLLPKMAFSLTAVTYDFGKTVGWNFKGGRDFSRDYKTDNAAIILNEAAVKYMQLKDPVGKIIRWNGNPFTVIGVIENMVTGSPYKPVQQSAYFMVPGIGPVITIRLNPQLSTEKAIARIETVFRQLDPASPFDYKFVDVEYGRKFAAEQRISTLSFLFALLAIFISCLGIFGLATFMAAQRVKEIGVRKILGASVTNLWVLLSREFVLMVVIALLIATPIAHYCMYRWLQQYDYHVSIAWWVFVIAGAGTLVITLLTISFQTLKATLTNPIRSLRNE